MFMYGEYCGCYTHCFIVHERCHDVCELQQEASDDFVFIRNLSLVTSP